MEIFFPLFFGVFDLGEGTKLILSLCTRVHIFRNLVSVDKLICSPSLKPPLPLAVFFKRPVVFPVEPIVPNLHQGKAYFVKGRESGTLPIDNKLSLKQN